MKFISAIIGSASGTLGGAVFARAKGGIAYARARVIPTNPRSLLQTAIRAAVQSVSSLWQTTLTELQQEGWFDIAEGAQTGKSLFAKVNQPRVYATNSTRITDETGTPEAVVPTVALDAPSGGLATAFAFDHEPVIDDSANTLDLGDAASGPWNVAADGTHMSLIFVYVSGPQTASRGSRQRPYQLLRAYAISDATGAITLAPINLAAFGIPTVVGRVFYVKTYAQNANGQASLPQEFRVTVQA